MTFEFHPDALEEYAEAGVWYEERRYRLGVEFTEAVEAGVAAILKAPDSYQPVGAVRASSRSSAFHSAYSIATARKSSMSASLL